MPVHLEHIIGSEEEIRDKVLQTIGRIAPEAPLNRIEAGRSFRDQFQFDSIDFLNFALALEEELGVRIPETDYPRLGTLKGCVEYLRARTGAASVIDQS